MLKLFRGLRSERGDPAECELTFQESSPPTIDLGGFTRGIDNIHVDVRLSPQFTTVAKRVLAGLLDQQVGRWRAGDKSSGPTVKEWEDFRAKYGQMLETAVHRAKLSNQPALVQLAQAAAIKFLLTEVQGALEQRRLTLKGAMIPAGGTDSAQIKINERVSWLARNRSLIRYTISRQMLDQVHRAESGSLALLHGSLLGEQSSHDLFHNPLLGAQNPLDDDVMMKHYFLMNHRSSDSFSFSALDSFFTELFKSFPVNLPWPSDPANIDLLFSRQQPAGQDAQVEQDKTGAAQLEARNKLRRRLLEIVEARCREQELLPKILAAYEMVSCYAEYSPVLNAQELHKFLSTVPGRKEIARRLKEIRQTRGKTVSPKALQDVAQRIAGISGKERQDYLVRFLKDFATLNRDLNSYHIWHNALDQIQLQDDPKNIRLSSANRTLYEFLARSEEGEAARTVRNHVILKADVRGSSNVVAELRRQGLNPASHFSLNFFNPINELLATFGADKVFIEGDAVILATLEHEEVGGSRLSVARACALARRLLNLVRARNATFKENGLPELELGIGLAFANESPAFLFDGETQIMISSAIGKADRLSSCSWLLRKLLRQSSGPTNVEVCELPEGDPLLSEKGENCLRYNVNGIELEAEGFAKLQAEILLQRIELVLPGQDGPMILHTGTYPDVHGNPQRVVIREGRIRLFKTSHLSLGPKTATPYYEVVTDETLLQKVMEALKSGI